jgi:hypothetical protein
MTTFILVFVHLALIVLIENYNGINISGLNSGAIILLALVLAFVFNQISTTHQSAKFAVLKEADALRTLGRISLNIDPDVGVPLMAATRLYTQTVIEKEWPKLNQGNSAAIHQGSGSALPALTEMSDIVYSSATLAKLPSVITSQLGQLVTRIRENRLMRIDASTFSIGITGLILAIITLVASSVLVSLTSLWKAPVQFISNFSLFLVTLTAMYLAFASQNPFAGLDSVVDTPLREALDRLKNMHLAKNP